MTTASWPVSVLRPRNVTRHLAARTTAGTVSASGFTQRVSVPAQAWIISYESILVATEEQIRAWAAYEAYLEGGAVPILVQLVGDPGPTDPAGDSGTVVGDNLAGDTGITVTRAVVPVLPGHHFSIGERLYRVAGANDLGGGQYFANFRPPLREAVANGSAVSFRTLVVKCRLATDDEMILKLEPGRIGVGNARFLEDPN